jgi:quercetin dioxygenase-like cupin family protein
MNENPLMLPDQASVLSLAGETHFAPHGIVSRTLLRTPQGRLVLFGFDAGQELTEHTSPHYALVQVLTGRCEWKLGGETRPLQAGDLLYMPPHLPHAVKATERFSMLLTLIKTGTPAD